MPWRAACGPWCTTQERLVRGLAHRAARVYHNEPAAITRVGTSATKSRHGAKVTATHPVEKRRSPREQPMSSTVPPPLRLWTQSRHQGFNVSVRPGLQGQSCRTAGGALCPPRRGFEQAHVIFPCLGASGSRRESTLIGAPSTRARGARSDRSESDHCGLAPVEIEQGPAPSAWSACCPH